MDFIAIPDTTISVAGLSGSPGFSVAEDNITIITDQNDGSANKIMVNALNTFIKNGDGDDTINIAGGSEDYTIFGDSGDDTFFLGDAFGKSYGGDGQDEFYYNNASATQLELFTSAMSIADGGSDFDSITFAGNVGNIDFSQVDDGIIKNIELLDFTMGANANIINLNYNDVINMTDSDNRLFIATDNSDTINFNNTSGNIFVESNDTVNVMVILTTHSPTVISQYLSMLRQM